MKEERNLYNRMYGMRFSHLGGVQHFTSGPEKARERALLAALASAVAELFSRPELTLVSRGEKVWYRQRIPSSKFNYWNC